MSDVPEHYLRYGGATLSAAIDKYVYVAVMPTPHRHIKVSYSKQECVKDVDDLQNDIVKNALKYFNIRAGIEITTFADIPTIGTGLAGSSAFTCALVRALAEHIGYNFTDYEVAEAAAHIEIKMCGWKIGKQDQYASAFGGMNYIQYLKEDRCIVQRIDPAEIDLFMLLIPTNIERHASEIIGNVDFQVKHMLINDLALIAKELSDKVPDLDLYGEYLNKSWAIKKQLDGGISNSAIDGMYDQCIQSGACGCKLLGAGGGGYVLALTDRKDNIRNAFSDRLCLDVNISDEGARVVYKD
jgi:D-glycero-alpha-D-manno-heptose-7-phosphate kinase